MDVVKINLSEFPKELLEQILIHLNDKELLTASHVCKSFKAAAEMAFAQKYSKERQEGNDGYIIANYKDNAEKSFQKVMLTKYGAKIQSLSMIDQDDELLTLVEQKCCSLKSVYLYDMSKMPMLKGLKKVMLSRVNLNRDTFADLINNNPGLESLFINEIRNDLLDIMDGRLNMLKSLSLAKVHYVKDLQTQTIRLRSLEALSIRDSKGCTCKLIWAMNRNAIKELELVYYKKLIDGMLQQICSLEALVSLRLPDCLLPDAESQLQELADDSPHLSQLSLKLKKDDSTNLQQQILL